MSELLLPLFPLQVVLFPGGRLPLHIFEERYKVLVRDSLAQNKEFGVVLTSGSEIAPVGCTALVSAVIRLYDDGRMDIAVDGQRRFRIHELQSGSSPYPLSVVSFVEDPEQATDAALLTDTIRLYNTVVTRAFKGKAPVISEDASAPDLSFLMAQKAGLEIAQRQLLLESLSENVRLQILREHFVAMIPRLERAEAMEQLIRNDGYLEPDAHRSEDE